MGIMIKTIQVCYGLILDIEVEALEQEVEGLKEEEARLKRADGKKSQGYTVEEAPR
jgi:hypothetical protein